MNIDTHISGLDASAWTIHVRNTGYAAHGWVISMMCGNFVCTSFGVMDDYGYLVEVPAPWQR